MLQADKGEGCLGCGGGGRDSWGVGLKSLALSELLMLRKTGTLLKRPVSSPGRLSH